MQSINEVLLPHLCAVQHLFLHLYPNAEGFWSKRVTLWHGVLYLALHFILPGQVNLPVAVASLGQLAVECLVEHFDAELDLVVGGYAALLHH